jgi:predicted metal-binding membrane protein
VANLTPVELLLRRDRLIVGGALAVAVGICWAWLVPAAHEMNLMLCDPTSWMMAASWDPRHVGTLFAMWAVMMAGMMLPAAAPTLMLYGCVVRKSPDGHRTAAQVNAFAGGYLLVWTVFSLGATLLQRVLTDFLLLSAMMEADSRTLSAVLLLTAGVYQLTPLKRTCLSTCRFPALYLTRHWRRGGGGRVLDGDRAWCLLSRLLLGADAAPVRRRGDESLVDRRAHAVRAAGKACPARGAGGTALRRLAGRARRVGPVAGTGLSSGPADGPRCKTIAGGCAPCPAGAPEAARKPPRQSS